MVRTALRSVAFCCCFTVAAVLLAYDAEVYSYAHYLAALMIFGALGALAVAVLIAWGNRTPAIERGAWAVGGFVMVAVLGGFVASRTVGLVGYHDPHWVWAGVTNMIAASVYLLSYVGFVLGNGGRMAPYPSEQPAAFDAGRVPHRVR